MNTEEEKEVISAEKTPPERLGKPWEQFVGWSQILGAVASLIATVVALVSGDFLSTKIFSIIPSAYLTILVIVVSASIGLGTVFYLAINLYQRQAREKHLALEALREKEKEFFQSIETDIASLLSEGGR